jgi:hypothetical protein
MLNVSNEYARTDAKSRLRANPLQHNLITMSFFRRNKNESLIPPVAQPSAPASDPYASAAPARSTGDPYARSNARGGGSSDPYARSGSPAPSYTTNVPGGSNPNPYAKDSVSPADAARNELFAGYAAPKVVADRKYGYEGREMEEDFDEDEEVEGIKQEMRGLKQDSLASTRWVLVDCSISSC